MEEKPDQGGWEERTEQDPVASHIWGEQGSGAMAILAWVVMGTGLVLIPGLSTCLLGVRDDLRRLQTAQNAHKSSINLAWANPACVLELGL